MTAPNIGDLLRAWMRVSEAQLARAVKLQQQRPNERLGALLVEAGAVERRALDEVLQRQAELRAGAAPKLDETLALADYAADILSGRAH